MLLPVLVLLSKKRYYLLLLCTKLYEVKITILYRKSSDVHACVSQLALSGEDYIEKDFRGEMSC